MKTEELISGYVGRKIRSESLNEIMSFGNIYPTDLVPPAFGITQRIRDIWQEKGIIICISLEYDSEITALDVEKYYDTSMDFYHPETEYLSLNQQELRIVKRILDYISG